MAWKRSLLPLIGPGILGGITLGDWWRLLCTNRFAISPRYLPRAMSITFHAFSNTILRALEESRHGKKIANVVVPPPLFLLGHWRNGTTLLHNLISVDLRFAFPNTYQALFPHSFLSCEQIGLRLLSLFLPKNRPMDNVEMGGLEPQEDEFALVVLTLQSPLLGWVFQRRRDYYDRYLTFDNVSEAERSHWRNTFLHFLQKLTLKYERPLVLKSPPHTVRVRTLLEMFPNAKFIHIHRNPFTVFQSSRRTFGVNFALDGLQHSDGTDIDEWILRQYRTMYDTYFADRRLIPAGQLCEVGFESLEKDPLGVVRRIYSELNLPDFSQTEEALAEYVAKISGYKKNDFSGLPSELQRRIVDAWRPCFEEWDYAHDEKPQSLDTIGAQPATSDS